ncbi:MAG: hypothetical protein H5U40_16580, partial [Polyangiaceae bacterium]|nr:hypothetical protein [Polyangiaceae bacterium]
YRASNALLIVTRAGSPAEKVVEATLPRLVVQRAPAGRRARLGSIGTDLVPLVAALTAVTPIERRPRVGAGEASTPTPIAAEAERRLAS